MSRVSTFLLSSKMTIFVVMLRDILLVGLGSALGGMLRYVVAIVGRWVLPHSYLLLSTLTVNLLGSFIIGAVLSQMATEELNHPLRLLIAIGFCGGFTTFSTFSAENLALLQSSQYLTFGLYALGSVVLCILGVWGGYVLFK